MADIDIQRKKSSPSPWLLIVLALVGLSLAAYFFLRPDGAEPAAAPVGTVVDTTAAPNPEVTAAPAAPAVDTVAVAAAKPAAPEPAPVTAETLTSFATTNPAAPGYARRGLEMLTTLLVDLADRDDLRTPAIREQRDNLTSATNRLSEPNASVRPGFVAAASLMQAMQQKAYPELIVVIEELVQQANDLSGRMVLPADQQQTQVFLINAAATVRTLSQPPRKQH
jgi:hypothetical protein